MRKTLYHLSTVFKLQLIKSRCKTTQVHSLRLYLKPDKSVMNVNLSSNKALSFSKLLVIVGVRQKCAKTVSLIFWLASNIKMSVFFAQKYLMPHMPLNWVKR